MTSKPGHPWVGLLLPSFLPLMHRSTNILMDTMGTSLLAPSPPLPISTLLLLLHLLPRVINILLLLLLLPRVATRHLLPLVATLLLHLLPRVTLLLHLLLRRIRLRLTPQAMILDTKRVQKKETASE